MGAVSTHAGELWTARQRQMHPIHYTISYRGSFKPELPDYFIGKYLKKASVVLDPFGGRGTTAIQANLMGHKAIHNDLSLVSVFLASSRQQIPSLTTLMEKILSLDLSAKLTPTPEEKEKLTPFFHKETLRELLCLRQLLAENPDDASYRYIGLTALSRLHGHSDGFFSVYSFPQISILPGAQRKNNARLKQKPEYKSIKDRIVRKIRRDLSEPLPAHFNSAAAGNRYLNCSSDRLTGVADSSVDLIVTSPPFLDKVDYVTDNWMRAWFLGLGDSVENAGLSIFRDMESWKKFMKSTMKEMGRVLRPGARGVIEVGDVRSKGEICNLEEILAEMLPIQGKDGELQAEEIFINTQKFTKLSNCWEVDNNTKGTNTNRCLVVRKKPG